MAMTDDTKAPELPEDGKRDPMQLYIEHTRGLWLRRNRSKDELELWYDGRFQCSWAGADVIEERFDAVAQQVLEIGERKAKAEIRKCLGL